MITKEDMEAMREAYANMERAYAEQQTSPDESSEDTSEDNLNTLADIASETTFAFLKVMTEQVQKYQDVFPESVLGGPFSSAGLDIVAANIAMFQDPSRYSDFTDHFNEALKDRIEYFKKVFEE